MAIGAPPVTLQLTWQGDRRFEARADGLTLGIDGAREVGPSPVQALALGLGGCMAIDVVDILRKGRAPVEGLEVHLTGERREEPPRRFVGFALHFVVRGAVPADRIERAIALSRERYCSVWHSLREDATLRTTFEVLPASPP